MDNLPWYRQFWPWFIFALPAVVVVASLTTWWIAANNADSLVADDYYKEGLAINRQLEKQERARALGIRAELRADARAVEVHLSGDTHPAALNLLLSHPLDAKYDRRVALARMGPRTYRGEAALAAGSRWIWRLEPLGPDSAAGWRIDGELVVPAER